MDTVHLKQTFVLAVFCLSLAGCGQQKPAPNTTSAPSIAASAENSRPTVVQSPANEHSVTPTSAPNGVNTDGASAALADSPPEEPRLLPDSQEAQPAGTAQEKQPQTVNQVVYSEEDASKPRRKQVATNDRPFTEAQYLSDKLLGVVVVHPQQLLASPVGEALMKELAPDDLGFAMAVLLKTNLDDIDRVTIPISLGTLGGLAEEIGLPAAQFISSDETPVSADAVPLSEIVGAFHAYHSAWGKFPRADSDGEGRYRGLSWRVHLLPYLDQNDLYDQFHLDEPWDSKHNKALISKMPEVFKTSGVTDEGKTAYHVFTGDETYFSGPTGYELKSSDEEFDTNRLLVIQAGDDTADFWTKPGGLELDQADVRKMLGEKRDKKYLAAFANGRIHRLPADINEQALASLVQLNSNGGEEVEVLMEAGGINFVGAALAPQEGRTELHQIGGAMLEYANTYFVLPRADGDGAGLRTGLSWRVHLLPFLGEESLYREFHLDEPWDSKHNQALISRMPDVFRTSEISDEGKTSYHVFTGEKTLFHGAWGYKRDDMGSSDPIVVIQAGADTAEVWTKPGGLAVDFNDPIKCLGAQTNREFSAITLMHNLKQLPADSSPSELANAIEAKRENAQNQLSDEFEVPTLDTDIPLPVSIITLKNDVSHDQLIIRLLDEATEAQHDGQTIHQNELSAVWFPDARTIVTGPIDAVKQAINHQKNTDREVSPLVDLLKMGADVSFAVNFEPMREMIENMTLGVPILGAINNIKSIDGQVSLSGNPGDPLLAIDVTMVEPEFAAGLFAIANMTLAQGRMIFGAEGELVQVGGAPERFMAQSMAAAKVEMKDDKIEVRLPLPEQSDDLSVLMKSYVTSGGFTNPYDSERYSALDRISSGFQNFEDAFGSYPGASCQRTGQPAGLSWRVHLLPFVGEPELYWQFKLNEPWDSKHNKTLIEKMPSVYKSPGVNEPGMTSMHVFVGQQAPFANNRTPQLGDFGAESGNSILMIVAGSDKADFWTKPGGLDFDPRDPIQALGKSIGSTYMSIRGDGSLQPIEKSSEALILSEMIQPQRTEAERQPIPGRMQQRLNRMGADFQFQMPPQAGAPVRFQFQMPVDVPLPPNE